MIAIIIAIVAITTGILGWKFAKKTQAPENPETAAMSGVQTQNQANQNANKLEQELESNVYKNEKFGFQLTLPKEWGGYKTYKDEWEDMTTAGVYFGIATKNKDWLSADLPSGYADLFAINVEKIDDYNKRCQECKEDQKNMGPACVECDGNLRTDVIGMKKIGKNKEYVFSVHVAQAIPDDLINVIYGTPGEYDAKKVSDTIIDKISKNFEIINEVAGGQMYRNEKYGFELTLPDGWKNYKVSVESYNIDDEKENLNKKLGVYIGCVDCALVRFGLPTSDKNYSYEMEKYGGNTILMLNIQDIFSWDKNYNSPYCKKKNQEDIECVGGYGLWGKNDKYAVTRGATSDIAKDLIEFADDVDNIKSTFKFIK